MAAAYGHLYVVRYLLCKGADMRSSANGWTVLHEAAQDGQLETVKYLVEEKGADLN